MSSPLFLASALKHYKCPETKEALLQHGRDREVSVQYGQGFGKRPDVLTYPADVLSFATRKATSFHCSEERWRDPLAIETGMTRRQLDELRTGWDLVLDIDCPYWEFSRLTAHLFIKALEAHGIESVTCKFSGSKGFHIGVPFEAFPDEYDGSAVKDLFPEAPRAIAEYLLGYIADRLITIKDNTVSFAGASAYTVDELKGYALPGKRLLRTACVDCGATWKEERTSSLCPSCQAEVTKGSLRCGACGYILEATAPRFRCAECSSSSAPVKKIDFAALIEVDTILLASRHLFRMPYSLHEKTGYASLPIDPARVLEFEKEEADPKTISFGREFLARDARPGEASDLLGRALKLHAERHEEEVAARKEYEAPEDAIPEEYFPPCMRLILDGLKDGKKRALFLLTNFLRSAGWSDAMIRDRIYEWNERNPDRLREVVIKTHLQLKEKKREVIPPPNCTTDYYTGIGVCKPDDLCRTIKNPAQYVNKKWRLDNPKKKARQRLTEEQKAMRRAYREKKKHESAQGSEQEG